VPESHIAMTSAQPVASVLTGADEFVATSTSNKSTLPNAFQVSPRQETLAFGRFQQQALGIGSIRTASNKDEDSTEEIKKVEATEATGSGSSGSYLTPAAWAKSTKKKDWRGKSKTQIPGGKFVQVKSKCKKFPYCNQGDIKALKLTNENEDLLNVIQNVSRKQGISENMIKNIIFYEYQKHKSNK
jgi:hypothetical protein